MLWAYKRILVAVEDEEIGDHICNFIANQSWSADGELRFIHVVKPQRESDPALLAESIKESVKYGQFILDKCAKRLTNSLNLPVGENLTVGYVVEQIDEEIADWKPDLLILGSHGRSMVGKWFFGSVSEALLAHVTCPVMVLRPPRLDKKDSALPPKAGWSKIVVAVEDNSQSQLLINNITSHKWAGNPIFTVLHIINTERLHESVPYACEGEREEAKADVFVKRIANQLKTMMPNCTVLNTVIIGTPAKDLLEYAAQIKADLLIAGSHGRTHAAKWFFGSVSEPLLSKAECAVVIIRPAKVKVKT